MKLLLKNFLGCKNQHGGCMKSPCNFRFDGDIIRAIGSKHVESSVETNRKLTYKLWIICCLQVINYKMVTVRNVEVISDKFTIYRICIFKY